MYFVWVAYIVLSKGAQTGCSGTALGAKWYLVTAKTVYGTPVFGEYKPLITCPRGEVTGYSGIEMLRKCLW